MAKPKYEEWQTEEGVTLLRGWKRAGLTDKEIADKIGINRTTLYDWKNASPDIDNALKKGKQVCDFEAEDALLSLFAGRYVEEEVTDVYYEGKGNDRKVVKSHAHKTKKWVPANVTAIIFYLKCRAGWKEQGTEEQTEAIGKLAEYIVKVEKEAHDRSVQ